MVTRSTARGEGDSADDSFWGRIVQHASDAIIVYDAELRFVALNRAAASVYGLEPAALVGRSRDDVVGPDDITPRLREVLRTQRAVTMLNEVVGTPRTRVYETIYQSVEVPGSGARYVVGISRELTPARDRRIREATIRELNSSASLLGNESRHERAAFIRLGNDGRVVEWPHGAETIFGWHSAEMVGTALRARGVFHADDADSDGIRRAFTKDGRTIFCSWTTTPLADGSLCVIQDVTAANVVRQNGMRATEKLRSLFENSATSIVDLARDGTITDLNQAALDWSGFERDEVLGTHFLQWLRGVDQVNATAAIEQTIQGVSSTFAITIARRDGTFGDLQCTTSPIFVDGECTGVFLVFSDISERRGAERALAKQHERVRELYLCAASGDLSAEAQLQTALELGCRLLGLENGAVFDAREEDGAIAFRASVNANAAQPEPIPEWLARETVRESRMLEISDVTAQRGTELAGSDVSLGAFLGTSIEVAGAHFGALCFAGTKPRTTPFPPEDRDFVRLIAVLIGTIIERRRARSHLRSLAYYDVLTGLPNRALLAERLDAALGAGEETGTRCAVLFLDLDRFKDINDTLGHALGDRLLQVAAERIVGCVRPTETVARMGGDEFIVVMPGLRDPSESTALAERLLHAIEGPITIAGFEQYTTTSIGISISPDDGHDADTLIKHADIAMYRAKDRGRNCYELYRPDLDVGMALRLAQETALRKGLERGEFRTYYQPLIDLGAGRVYGVEALARWQHSTLSLLSPQDFIATAESSGLIVKLGEFVLDDACRQVLAWRDAGLGELRLSVNLSARQFREPDLLESLTKILGRTGFPPHLLDLEITESVAMSKAADSVEIMRALKSIGVRMMLDDFGTGYSSLGYLRRFPLDGLKIDHEFTSGIGRERDDETIVEAVIAMAHKLGLQVVAEGVETQEQVDFLLREHCHYVQGNYYAPALTAHGCERYVRAWSELRGPQHELRSVR